MLRYCLVAMFVYSIVILSILAEELDSFEEPCCGQCSIFQKDYQEKCTCTSEPCSVEYNDLTVECHGEINIANFNVRKYTLRRHMTEKEVQRLKFCGWLFSGLPDVSSFVKFVKYANKVKYKLDGPIMVYCRFGIDCTGTFIALDILSKQGKDTGRVDIQSCKQYEFLHKALVYCLTPEYDIESEV